MPDETLAGLKRRAERHHRSLQKELRVLLDEASRMQPAEEKGKAERLRLRRVRTGGAGTWSREEIETEDVSRRLKNLVRQHKLHGKRIHDANIAATLLAHGLDRLMTDNPADFKVFKQIATVSP